LISVTIRNNNYMNLAIFVIVATFAIISIKYLIAKGITRPVKTIVDTANAIAAGDFQKEIDIQSQDEIGTLADAFRNMKDMISKVLMETDGLIQAGKLDKRGNAEGFAGGWRELVMGVNNVMEAFEGPFNMTARTIDRISKGDIPHEITETYEGNFNEIRNNLNRCVKSINGLVTETVMLTEKAAEGDLGAITEVFIFVEDNSHIAVYEVETSGETGDWKTYFTSPKKIRCAGKDAGIELNVEPISEKFMDELSADSDDGPANDTASIPAIRKELEKRKTETISDSVRVSSDKLDKLVSLVGELVINQARMNQVARGFKSAELDEPLESLERLTGDLRDIALNMRMLPIGTIFGKFRRLVRDMSTEFGKEIELVTEGAETELDKTVIERLNDPLVHLIRNSIDHGIESAEEREKAGKSRESMIRLTAVHKEARIIISIEDDGGGMDIDAIRAKAVENELIPEKSELNEDDILGLIFKPGFSTATKINGLSGRGVGMDVVKRKITSMGGTIRISHKRGEGTSIQMSMPHTLAIIDGLMVGVNDRRFVIPVELVRECRELTRIKQTDGRNLIDINGELIPFIRLQKFFKLQGKEPSIKHIAVVAVDQIQVGVIVDHIIGNIQTVIKPLDRIYRHAKGISGTTILGDGTVALIIDAPELIHCAKQNEKASYHVRKKKLQRFPF